MFTLHNGDCLEYMKTLQPASVDCIVTDPPYEVETDKRSGGHLKKTSTTWKLSDINKGFDYLAFWKLAKPLCTPYQAYLFCSNDQISTLMSLGENDGLVTTLLVWNKYNSIPFASGTWRQDAEFAIHFRESGAWFEGDAELKRKVITRPINNSKFGHPTEKPLDIVKKYILVSTKPGDTVFDPFMGSGTTGVACVQLGRRFIGCEINPKYFAVAEKRIKSAVLQPGLFTPSNNACSGLAGTRGKKKSSQSDLFSVGDAGSNPPANR